jgi:hypothetical protein
LKIVTTVLLRGVYNQTRFGELVLLRYLPSKDWLVGELQLCSSTLKCLEALHLALTMSYNEPLLLLEEIASAFKDLTSVST